MPEWMDGGFSDINTTRYAGMAREPFSFFERWTLINFDGDLISEVELVLRFPGGRC